MKLLPNIHKSINQEEPPTSPKAGNRFSVGQSSTLRIIIRTHHLCWEIWDMVGMMKKAFGAAPNVNHSSTTYWQVHDNCLSISNGSSACCKIIFQLRGTARQYEN